MVLSIQIRGELSRTPISEPAMECQTAGEPMRLEMRGENDPFDIDRLPIRQSVIKKRSKALYQDEKAALSR
jgi:hypothetical protein